jgi:hypothetical protein
VLAERLQSIRKFVLEIRDNSWYIDGAVQQKPQIGPVQGETRRIGHLAILSLQREQYILVLSLP